MPGLSSEDRRLVEDAVATLRFLEREKLRYDADEKRSVLGEALQYLRSLAPTIQGHIDKHSA